MMVFELINLYSVHYFHSLYDYLINGFILNTCKMQETTLGNTEGREQNNGKQLTTMDTNHGVVGGGGGWRGWGVPIWAIRVKLASNFQKWHHMAPKMFLKRWLSIMFRLASFRISSNDGLGISWAESRKKREWVRIPPKIGNVSGGSLKLPVTKIDETCSIWLVLFPRVLSRLPISTKNH